MQNPHDGKTRSDLKPTLRREKPRRARAARRRHGDHRSGSARCRQSVGRRIERPKRRMHKPGVRQLRKHAHAHARGVVRSVQPPRRQNFQHDSNNKNDANLRKYEHSYVFRHTRIGMKYFVKKTCKKPAHSSPKLTYFTTKLNLI